MKTRMLPLKVVLALIVFGGIGSALVLYLSLASALKAPPSGAPPSGIGASGPAQVPGDCLTVPHACGFPDGTNTGVPSGTALRSVPGQVSSGPGWHFDPKGGGCVVVTARGTVLSGLSIPYNLVIEASDVTVQDVRVVTGGYFGISLAHTTGVTIKDSTISGRNATTGRVDAAISDVYSDSTGIMIKNNNISKFRTGVQISTGLIVGNYIHDPGYIDGDHTNGIAVERTAEPMTIYHNTVVNDLGQTDDITLNAPTSGRDVATKIVVDNLLAGGGYSIYGGNGRSNPTSNIVIEDNKFSQLYHSLGGQFGPVAYFDPTGTGNVWSGNVWSGTSLPGKVAVLPGVRRSGAPPGSAASG